MEDESRRVDELRSILGSKENHLLTQRHLALIRAALQFFNEEIVPHGRKTIGMYLDVPVKRGVTAAEIQELRLSLQHIDVKYGRYHVPTRQLSETRLRRSVPKMNLSEDDVTVILLIPRHQ